MEISPDFIDKIAGGGKRAFVGAIFLIEGDYWGIFKITPFFLNALYIYLIINGTAGAALIYKHQQESKARGHKCPICEVVLEGQMEYRCPTHGELFKK